MNVLTNLLIFIPVMIFAAIGLTAWFIVSIETMQAKRTGGKKTTDYVGALLPWLLLVLLMVGLLLR